MVRKWEAMYYLRKCGGFSLIALFIMAPSLVSADTIVTSQTYVDLQDATKVDKAQGVANAGNVLVVGNDGNVTTAASNTIGDANVIEGVQVNGTDLAIDANKKVNINTAGGVASGGTNLVTGGQVYSALPTTMTGADGTNAGTSGLVPAPTATDNTKFLNGAGQWATPTDNNTTYTGSDGITLTGTNFTNSGVRAVATGTTAGTVSVNTDGTSVDIAVNGFTDKQTKPSTGVANGKVLTYTGTDANANVSAAYVTVPVASGAPSSNTPTAFAEVWVQ